MAEAPVAAPQRGGVVGWFTDRGIFYGWVVVFSCWLASGITGILFQGLSTFVTPLQREFGWNNATIGMGRAVQQLEAFFGPMYGVVIDRVGTRVVMVLGVLMFGTVLASLSLVQSEVDFFLVSFGLAIGNGFMGILAVNVAISHWFERKRSFATGLAVMGFALSGAIVVPALVWAEAWVGWRGAAVLTGVAVILIGLPSMLLVRDQPGPYGLQPDGDRDETTTGTGATVSPNDAFTVQGALKTRSFWLITSAVALMYMGNSGMVTYHFPHIENTLTRETAAWVIAVMNLFNVVGRLAGGYLGDHLPKRLLMGTLVSATGIAGFILAVARDEWVFLAYGALFGLSFGARTPVTGTLLSEYFGRKAFGRVYGITNLVATPLALAGPLVAGAIADASGGSYVTGFYLCGAVNLAAGMLYFLARRPTQVA
jgi:MFS family permease